jgi:hypothetical protein
VNQKLSPGNTIDPFVVRTIHGKEVSIPGDPGKKFYKQFGVESSPLAILNPSAWGAMVKGNLARDKPPMKGFPENGPFGLPADFLLSPEGKLVAVHYGSHAYDQWSVEDVLAKLKTR